MSTRAKIEALAAELRETAKAATREAEVRRDNDRMLYLDGQAHGLRYATDRLDEIAAARDRRTE